MPILAREPALFPENLFDVCDTDDGQGKQWFAIHTRPRSEKNLARRLHKLGIWHHLPLHEHKYLSPKGRKCVSYLPLFPSYLFLLGSDEDRYRAMTTDCIVRVMEVPDTAQLAFDLRQIHRLLEAGATFTPESKLQPGTNVRVTSGPFEDFEGRIIKRQTGEVLLVVVNYLQQGVTISLDDCQVEAI